jgi:hypothetical protein
MPRAIAPWALLLLLPWAGFSQHQQKDDPKKADEPIKSEVRFMDDSIVRVFLLPEKLDLVTRYGKLSIPVSECQRVDFGVRCPEGLEQKIMKAIDDLGAEPYKVRETALKNLIEWGPYAYPRLYQASKSGTPEVAKRVAIALEKIRAKHPARNLRLREEDVIVTPFFTVVGHITNAQLKTKSKNFGELSVTLADLRSIRVMTTVGGETELTIDAAKYGSDANSWMDSGFEATGARLTITASGTVDLWPQGPGYTCPPTGYQQGGRIGPHLPGQLLGKIGESGTLFIIGDRYDGTPPGDGKLFLHIVHSPWGNASAGSYLVKIVPSNDFSGN